MKKQKIKEVIVVEGKHDYAKIKSCIEADVIVTNGTHLSQKVLEEIKELNQKQGVIVFTDPDGPGEQIRTKIIQYVGTTKHASLNTKQTKTRNKVGIEHANCIDIIEALDKCATFDVSCETLSWIEFMELGLSGNKDSQEKRNFISTKLSIPMMNAKRCYKYMNMLGLSKEDCASLLEEYGDGNNIK